MSFAAAVYGIDGRDVAIGADGLWSVPQAGGTYLLPCFGHPAVKCLRLGDSLAVAFTGAAALIQKVLACVYEDSSILDLDAMAVGVELNGRDLLGTPSMGAVADTIGPCLPDIIAGAKGTAAEDDLSIILAGRHAKRPHVMGWSEETKWKPRDHRPRPGSLGWMTMPPDGAAYKGNVAAILGHVPSSGVEVGVR